MPDQEVHIKDDSKPRQSLCGKTPPFMVSSQFADESDCFICTAMNDLQEEKAG